MKTLLLFAGSLFTHFCASCQGNSNVKDSILVTEAFAFNVPKAKLLFETEKGKVYELPLDKMRCLDPVIRSNMPVIKRPFENNNSGSFEKVIPVPIPNVFDKSGPLITTPVQKLPLSKFPLGNNKNYK